MHYVYSVKIDPPQECCPKTATVTLRCGQKVTTTANIGRMLREGSGFKGLAGNCRKCAQHQSDFERQRFI